MQLHIKNLALLYIPVLSTIQQVRAFFFIFSFSFGCYPGGGRETRKGTGQGQIWFPQETLFQSNEPFKHCRVKHALCISKAKSQAKIGKIKQVSVHFQVV